MINLPPPVPKPCNDCPWRRNATPGWLGPMSVENWLEAIHGEYPIACHETIRAISHEADWSNEGLRQCMGAAIYRCNVFKVPRNPKDAKHVAKENREDVFASDKEFRAYHTIERIGR